ncbi:hypothetical protein ACFXPS_28340 [Nocardia sp. NPDC059091]|uniref:hypothetical protein n=1 Tax=unclassified Nocardia TaxID=2637762 RepID=UPI0036BB4FEA
MPSVELKIGQWGTISSKKYPDRAGPKKCRAWTKYRDTDGVSRPVDCWDTTEPKARAKLKDILEVRQAPAKAAKEGLLTPNTRFSTALDMWLEELKLDETMVPQTIDGYERQINKSDDKRADPDAIKIRPMLGNYRIREIDTAVVDNYLKSISKLGYKRKARWQATILRETLDLCIRHGALTGANPMSGVSKRTMRSRKKSVKAEAWTTLQAMRETVEKWGRGEEIPGTPAYKHGPRRDSQEILDVCDCTAGAGGVRPHEVFAFEWDEVEGIDFDATKWPTIGPDSCPEVWLTISGTVVTVKGQGCFRQERLKVGKKPYRVRVPWYMVLILRRRWDEAGHPSDGLIFVNRNGKVKNPNNFNRTFRAARETEYAHITLRSYRKRVATATAEEKGIDAAGLQLNHVLGSRVTAEHYVEKPRDVPDNRDVLNAYVA